MGEDAAGNNSNVKGLQDLVEDVLILILMHCDVLSVVAIGGTNKYFHHLAFTRDVWLPLMTSLVERRFIDSRPETRILSDLSTEQLVDEVKRILRGPVTWSPATHSHPSEFGDAVRQGVNWVQRHVFKSPPTATPVESRRIILHPQSPKGNGILRKDNEAKLLPGGRYVLYQNWGRLQCWNVFEDKLIWTHACSMNGATVLAFAAELTDDDQAVIVTCQRTRSARRENFLEFTAVNFQTGGSSLILVSPFPESQYDNPYEGCTICGDIAAVELINATILFNWRTSSFSVIVKSAFDYIYKVALAANCLVLALLSPSGQVQLACSPLPSSVSWKPIDGIRDPSGYTNLLQLPLTFVDTISVDGRTFAPEETSTSLSVFESPIHPGRFRVWLHLVTGKTGVLCSYESVGESEVFLRKRSSVLLSSKITSYRGAGISFSGHILLGWQGELIQPAPSANESSVPRMQLTLENRGDFVHLSPYSGALTYSTSEEIVIVYYV